MPALSEMISTIQNMRNYIDRIISSPIDHINEVKMLYEFIDEQFGDIFTNEYQSDDSEKTSDEPLSDFEDVTELDDDARDFVREYMSKYDEPVKSVKDILHQPSINGYQSQRAIKYTDSLTSEKVIKIDQELENYFEGNVDYDDVLLYKTKCDNLSTLNTYLNNCEYY